MPRRVKVARPRAIVESAGMADPIPPDDCMTMAEVRTGVDETDRRLIELLGRRFGYMRAAARIKPDRQQVRDEERKARVIASAIRNGEAQGIPRAIIARLWDRLVEESIAYEFERFDARGDRPT